ncbi:polymorphic toxin type 30 domain-containing protein [Enterococcus sp. BWR-S5]|uniref:polymorphic toxin type 30 domain-containing protein n=1 Tax=Enterococcus sp. BWR-S5 TaxID=2787714 RepID=UPI0019233238|nr:polymorphic toxin type 30 domain-containing protein [Enterococcus sp. BWR-S5]MBL1224267.1 hypothetical protein [Enterococcus sp. BWR-S5]
MSYRICFDDVTNIHVTTSQSFNKCGETLSKLAEQVTTFTNLPSLKGKAADSMKAYLQEVHGTLLASISELITEYQVRFLLYKDELFQLDNDLHAELDEATFDSLLSFFPNSQNGFQSEVGDLKSVVDTISDLISEYGPNDLSIDNGYGELIHSITTLREDVGTCEHTHASNDLTSFKELLSSFEGLVSSYMGQSKSVAIQYQSGAIADIPVAQQLNTAYANSQARRAGLENKIKDAAGRDEQRFAQLEKEAAEERANQGIWQAIGAIATVLVGTVAIVATAGMATPIVATAWIAGSASVAYGVSNLTEAGQHIYYGSQGDATTFAFNPLRDTVFMGNQKAYDAFGFTATFVAGSMIPIGNAVNMAQSAGTSVTKAVIIGTGRSAVTAAAGYGGGVIGSNIGYTISKDIFGTDHLTAQNWANAFGMAGSFIAMNRVYKATGINYKKTGSGDFSDIKGSTYEDAINRVPKNANESTFKPSQTIKEGRKFNWTSKNGTKYFMEAHGKDSSVSSANNAGKGWVTRIKQGKNYFDPQTGNWVRSNVFNPNSPSYNPALVNGTHIPIQSPVHIWNSPYPYIPQPHDKKE